MFLGRSGCLLAQPVAVNAAGFLSEYLISEYLRWSWYYKILRSC